MRLSSAEINLFTEMWCDGVMVKVIAQEFGKSTAWVSQTSRNLFLKPRRTDNLINRTLHTKLSDEQMRWLQQEAVAKRTRVPVVIRGLIESAMRGPQE